MCCSLAFYKEIGCLQSDEEVERAVAEANVFALASHQFWGVWAFFQAAYSAIDFDYLAYADLRWSEFRRRKEDFLKPFIGERRANLVCSL